MPHRVGTTLAGEWGFMTTTNRRDTSSSEKHAVAAAIADAPGAVPPTQGVPPSHGAPSKSEAPQRSATENLADALELLRRAARKTLGEVDPRMEAIAERAVTQLRALDAQVIRDLAADRARLEQLAQASDQAGRMIVSAVERMAQGIDSILHRPKAV